MPYIKHLSADKKLAPVIKQVGRLQLKKRNDVFLSLCGSIMSQQLSTKVAAIIHQRFNDLFDGKPTPEKIANISAPELKAIGLSNSKTDYIKNVAAFALTSGLGHAKLSKLSDEALIEYLTQIKGVGKWTAEMILMFTLAREDVFSYDDYGIQQAVIGLYGIRIKDKKKLKAKILKLSEGWKPYRTYACMYLWSWRDTK